MFSKIKHISNMKIKNQVILLFITLAANSAAIILLLLFWFNGYIYNNIIDSVKDMNSTIEENIQNILSANRRIAEESAIYIEEMELMNNFGRHDTYDKQVILLSRILTNLAPDMLYSFVYQLEGNRNISVSTNESKYYYKIIEDYNLQEGQHKDSFYTKIYVNEELDRHYYGYVYPLRKDNKVQGYYINIYNFKSLHNEIDRLLNNPKAIYSFYYNNQMVYSSMENLTFNDQLEEHIKHNDTYWGVASIQDESYFVQLNAIEDMEWKYVICIPRLGMFSDIYRLIMVFVIMTVIIATFGISFFISITKSISKPINNIINQLENITDYTNANPLEVTVENEVSSIVNHINKMLHKINKANAEIIDTQSQLYEIDLARTEAELSYYQSQINPHFLYNNLEFIRSLGAIFDIWEIEKIAVAMSHIFRYSIKANNVVTIQDELQCIENYFSIMDLRFPGKYMLSIAIDEEDRHLRIPKMILQPIVENAFKHGFVKERNNGRILLKGDYKKASDNENNVFYFISIIDTGMGMEESTVKKLNRQLKAKVIWVEGESMKRIGLFNINNRLKIQYGEESGVEIISQEGYYTKVILKIAMNKPEN